MIKITLTTTTLVIFLSTIALSTTAQQNQRQNVKLTVLNGMERINVEQVSSESTQAIVRAAKNETESFQVLVHALEGNAVVLNAEMSDLSGKAGTISKDNVTLFREEYTRVRRSSPHAKFPPGLYPDPLVPFINPETGKPIEPRNSTYGANERVVTHGFEMYAVPFEVWKGESQPIWVDVFVPGNASAGEYKGTLKITIYNGSFADMPRNDLTKPRLSSDAIKDYSVAVTLTVWDFALPDGPTLGNSFNTVYRVAAAFGLDRNSTEFQEIELNYCKMLAANRINPPFPERFLPEMNEDGSLKITPERNAALKKFIEELHVTDFRIPALQMRDMTTVNREKAIRYYREYYKYLKENGWDKRGYVYMLDEPNSKESYERIVELGKLVDEAAPELRRLVVEQPFTQNRSWPDINPAVDIWCPLFAYIDRDSINDKLAQGDEVWSYAAVAQRAPSYTPKYSEVKDYDPPYWEIDQPLTYYRIPAWMNWQYGITGLLYWSTVYSTQSVAGVMDPWFLPVYSSFGRHYNGEGYLMYPGKPCGINGPVPSIRLKNLRDAMEDYEYFVILEKLSSRKKVTDFVSTIVPNWWSKPNPKDFISVREKIANEIIKIKK